MSETQRTTESTVREIPLSDLAPPHQDVRQGRDPDGLRNLAQSMEQNGQLVPANVHVDPEFLPDDPEFEAAADLEELIDESDKLRVTDGWSRLQAAEMLDWPTLRCEVSRQTDADTVVEQLAANTDRLDMSDYETIRALADYMADADVTQTALASRIGMSESYFSQLLSALREPEPIVEAWADPHQHIETGHVLEIKRLDSAQDKRLVFNSVMEHDQGVTATRKKVDYQAKNPATEDKDPEEIMESRKDGYDKREQQRETDADRSDEQDDACLFCGGEHVTRMYVPVCEEDYAAIDQARRSGQPLMGDPEEPREQPAD